MKILLSALLFMTGCGHAWVISENSSGGTIGYSGFMSSSLAKNAIERLIHCDEYDYVSDRLVSGGSYTSYVPVQKTAYNSGTISTNSGPVSYSGQQTYTSYQPTQVDLSWREYTYQCTDVNIRYGLDDSCRIKCNKMFSKGQLKTGMSLNECYEKMCDED